MSLPNLGPVAETIDNSKSKQREQFTIYRNTDGEIVCRAATPAERRQADEADLEKLGLRPINHLDLVYDKSKQSQNPAAANLTIVLRATQQLQQNQAAVTAFNRAAQNWETLIMSPVTIFVDVDYGATNFGQTWPSGVLGATSTPSHSYPYPSVRGNLIAEANGEGNATKQAIFNALPPTAVPSDLGDSGSTIVSDSNARAVGLLPATAQSTDSASRIAFNSNFTFDFDPSDGITAGQIDFDAVATHEIGHALGFHSENGLNLPRPSIWDLYRFRTGQTPSTFSSAPRILTIGGSPNPLHFFFAPGNAELGLSTGGPVGSFTNGADGWQSSHWKQIAGGCGAYIGIMNPAIPSGCRRTITSSDALALSSFGYNMTNINTPPPQPAPPSPPANDSFANAQPIGGCYGDTTGTNFSATSESGEPSHNPAAPDSLSPNRTVWYQWQAPASGTTMITTDGSEFDTILSLYTGSSVESLTRIGYNDDVQSGTLTSSVTFNADAGTTYQIAIDGWGGDMGGIKLNWIGCVGPAVTATPIPTPTQSRAPAGIRQIALPTNDIVYDPVSQRIFASVPSSAGNIGNTITEVNPFTASVGPSVFIGREPGLLAIADTFHYIYASLDSIAAVRRFDLTSRTAGLQFRMGSDPSKGTRYVRDMAVLPSTPGSVAISRRFIGVSPEHAGVAVYDDGIQRPTTTAADNGSNIIEFSASSSKLYGVHTETTEFGFRKMAINGSGVSVTSVNTNLISGFGVNIRFDNGLLYTSNGRIIDPESGTGTQVGSFGSIGFSWMVLPDASTNRIYFLSTISPSLSLRAYDKTTLALLGTLNINGVSGDPRSFIKWGADGLAFRTTGNRIYLLSTSDVVPSPVPNPIDQPDFFVKQHYLDFLNREPDPSGLDFWKGEIDNCTPKPQCTELKRINVSAAFYLSIEFQGTGYLVERMYKAAYGDAMGTSTFNGTHQLAVPVVRFNEFLSDTQKIGLGVVVGANGWEQILENNKQACASEFVQRTRFMTAFPSSMTATQFVDQLNTNAGNPLSLTERNQLVNDLSTGAKSRAQVLRAVSEDQDLNNAEFNRAFVLMQFFGYLRRNPNDPQDTDYTGYDFWLTKLNQFNGSFVNAEMVKAFINSSEYRQRFGP